MASESPFSLRLRKLKSLRGIFLPFFISVSPIPSVNGHSHPPWRPSLCFHPSTLRRGETLKAGLKSGRERNRGEISWKERKRVCVLNKEKSKKWSAINGKRNRQRMENNWRKMEARISKENASRWKKGGSSRDSCLRSLLLLYLGVTKREREEKRTRERERQSYDQLELSTLSSTVPFLSSPPSSPSKATLWTLSIILFLHRNCSPPDSAEGIRLGVSLWY